MSAGGGVSGEGIRSVALLRATLVLCVVWLSLPALADGLQDKSVLAEVGGVAITREDLENALKARIKSELLKETSPNVKAAVLKDLIVELAAKQVVTNKEIQRSPELTRKLESAHRQLLLNYFLDKNVKTQPPSSVDVDKFVNEHPEFYQDRMMYHYVDIVIDPQSDSASRAVKDRLGTLVENKELDIKNIERFIEWLSENHIPYGMSRNWLEADKLKGVLPSLLPGAAKRDIKVIVDRIDTKIRVIGILGVYPDPVSSVFGRTGAAQILADQARSKQVAAAIEKLLAKAYVDAPFR
jgi:EpsD family peptidyl-prolyl cis-trans isomerase